MERAGNDYGLEFLLAFNGRIHHLDKGFWLKFAIERVLPSEERPHGISYSLTLHGPTGRRLLGFDNAHGPPGRSRRDGARAVAHDHWHRTDRDPGRPYTFIDAATLIDDFFAEVERILAAHGLDTSVLEVRDTRS